MIQGNQQPTSKRFIDERELAPLLGVSPRTLQDWRWRGVGLPFIRIGRSVRYATEDVEHFIAENRQTTSASVYSDESRAA